MKAGINKGILNKQYQYLVGAAAVKLKLNPEDISLYVFACHLTTAFPNKVVRTTSEPLRVRGIFLTSFIAIIMPLF